MAGLSNRPVVTGILSRPSVMVTGAMPKPNIPPPTSIQPGHVFLKAMRLLKETPIDPTRIQLTENSIVAALTLKVGEGAKVVEHDLQFTRDAKGSYRLVDTFHKGGKEETYVFTKVPARPTECTYYNPTAPSRNIPLDANDAAVIGDMLRSTLDAKLGIAKLPTQLSGPLVSPEVEV